MKKFISILLVLAMIFALAACGGGSSAPAENKPAETKPAESKPEESKAEEPKAELPTYNWQLGFNTVEDSVRGDAAHAFKDYLEKNSDGRITVDLFPSEALGSEQVMTEMVKTKSLDFTLAGITSMTAVSPDYGATGLPFLCADYDQWHSILDGEYGDIIRGIGEANGYKHLALCDLGSVQITNSKRPIYSLADMKGLNMRSTNEEVALTTFQALGCSTTTMAFSELYLAMSQKVVDGQFNPIDAIYQNKFTEVQDYLAMVNIFYYGFTLICNNEWFNELDPETQNLVLEAGKAAQEASRKYMSTSESTYLQKCKDENCFKEITYPDTAEFQAACADIYGSFLAKCTPETQKAINDFIGN